MEVIIKVYAKEDEYFTIDTINKMKSYTKDKEYDAIIKSNSISGQQYYYIGNCDDGLSRYEYNMNKFYTIKEKRKDKLTKFLKDE